MASTVKRGWWPALGLLVAVSSCRLFSPTDVYFSCEDGGVCPTGLSCNARHYCVEDAGVEPPDAGPDVATLYRDVKDQGPWCTPGGACIEYPLSGGRDLSAVAGLATNEVWVAGASDFAAFWDGKSWRRVDVPDAGSIRGIAGYPAVPREWVAGSSTGVFRLNGGAWEHPESPLGSFTAVAASALSFVMVGPEGKCALSDLATQLELVVPESRGYLGPYYDPCLLTPMPSFRSAWGLPDGGFWITADDGLHALGFVPRELPGIDAGATDLFAVTATADGQIGWATGDGGFVLRWDGKDWSPVPGAGETLISAAAAGEEAWFAGATSGGLFRHDGGVLLPVSTGTSQHVLALWTPPDGRAWAVGQGGLILHWDGASWTRDPQAITRDLAAIAGRSAGELWAGGEGVTLLARDGGWWGPAAWPGPSAGTIRAIWVGASDVWLGVDSNIVRLSDGQVEGPLNANVTALWGPTDRPTIATVDGPEGLYEWDNGWSTPSLGNPMYAVQGANGAIFAVGASSRVVRKGVAGWDDIGSGLGGNLRGVWTQDGGEVWVAGQNGYVASYSATWVEHPGTPAVNLTALAGANRGNLYAVGAAGTVAHWDGGDWQTLPSGTQAELLGATYVPGAGLFVVGRGGVILHYGP